MKYLIAIPMQCSIHMSKDWVNTIFYNSVSNLEVVCFIICDKELYENGAALGYV